MSAEAQAEIQKKAQKAQQAQQEWQNAQKVKQDLHIKATAIMKFEKMKKAHWEIQEKTKHIKQKLVAIEKETQPTNSLPPSLQPPSLQPPGFFDVAATRDEQKEHKPTDADKKLLADLEAALAKYRKKNKGRANSASMAMDVDSQGGQFVAPGSGYMTF